MSKEKELTPLRAVKAWCRDCSGFQPKEVRLCPSSDCPLYQYRMGRNPRRRRQTVNPVGLVPELNSETNDFHKEEAPNG